MTKQEGIVEFTATMTSVTVTPGPAGNLIGHTNVEGSSKEFGPLHGTVTYTPAGHAKGTWEYHAYAFPPDGRIVTGSARTVRSRRPDELANDWRRDTDGGRHPRRDEDRRGRRSEHAQLGGHAASGRLTYLDMAV